MNIEKHRLLKDPIVIKGLAMVLMILLLLIPLGMIGKLISDRDFVRKAAEDELIESYGGELVLTNPILVIPYIAQVRNSKNEIDFEERSAYFLPRELMINGIIDPQIKNRGIYEFLLYRSEIDMSGYFSRPDFSKMSDNNGEILWDKAYITIEISSIKGFSNRPELSVNGQSYTLESSSRPPIIYNGGLSSPVTLSKTNEKIPFNLKCNIQGGRKLGLLPLSAETTVTFNSPWESPSFFGAYLPKGHKIVKDEGFSANWYITSFLMDKVDMSEGEFESMIFGVKLLFPVNLYQMTERSIKYGILFLIIPFVTFFLMEIFSKKRIHIFHYMFVGISSILFFLLLLAFGEHFSFNIAYIIGVTMVSVLITYYACYILKSKKQGLLLLPIMLVTYIFMYIMINSEDYALLMGSIGLFTLVTGIMVATRKIDWFELGIKQQS